MKRKDTAVASQKQETAGLAHDLAVISEGLVVEGGPGTHESNENAPQKVKVCT